MAKKHQHKPWITNGIRTSIKIKHRLYRNLCKEKQLEKRKELEYNFKLYRKHVLKLIRTSKEAHYKTFFSENKEKTLEVWNAIKEIINIKKTKQNIQPVNLNIDDKLSTDVVQISEHFNDYFTSIASKIDSKIVQSAKSPLDYLTDYQQNSFFLNPTTKEEVEDIISTMKNNKATGPNSIPTKILKDLKNSLAQPLSDIINISFETSTFPNLLKVGKVIPIFKKGNKLECSNYRPISLLSNISKIFEKIVHIRLYMFLKEHRCLYSYQFGFRCSYSTNHALISLTEEIRTALDNDEYACGVFIDLQKAFDTVNHRILLTKLERYGVRGIPLQWFNSYLSDRTQFTFVNEQESTLNYIRYGVPQGSVLGPLLFLIYINDMNRAIKHSKIKHFADDTNILYISRSLKKINKQINHDLSRIVQWLRTNRISLNVQKTDIIVFRRKGKMITKHLNFRFSGQNIKPTNKTTYLGITLDENLNFKSHLELLRKKLSRANGLLSKIRHYVSLQLLRTIYFAIFDSHLRYACQIWGQGTSKEISSITKLQDKALRIINFKLSKNPCDPLYHLIKILKLRDIIKLNNCLFAFDSVGKTVPLRKAIKGY